MNAPGGRVRRRATTHYISAELSTKTVDKAVRKWVRWGRKRLGSRGLLLDWSNHDRLIWRSLDRYHRGNRQITDSREHVSASRQGQKGWALILETVRPEFSFFRDGNEKPRLDANLGKFI